LWAEAKAMFDAGSVWWLDSAELVRMATDEQTERYEGDRAWAGCVNMPVKNRSETGGWAWADGLVRRDVFLNGASATEPYG
jgi:hypothetical protein